MAKLIVGAQLYTLRDFCKTLGDFVTTLKKVKDIGYTAIQISGIGPIDPKEVGKAVKDSGLTVACTHMGWNRFQTELDRVIEEHQMWNCKHPAIGGLPGEYQTSLDGVKKFVDELTPIAERLAKAGMDFSYHNHHIELARHNGKTWLGALYETAPAKVLKAEIDTYWIQAGGGDPVAWIRKCAGREPVIHFKDMTAFGWETRMAEIGEGNLNWPAIIEACNAGAVEFALVEQDNCYGRDPFESLAISYRNLKAMGLK